MFRTSVAVAGVALLAALSLTGCDEQKSCDTPSAQGNQTILMAIDITERAGGGHGSGGHESSGSHESGSHASSGHAHPEVAHPATAPEKLPAPQPDTSHPGYVTYPGWPGYYRPGMYPSGYAQYYDCRAGN